MDPRFTLPLTIEVSLGPRIPIKATETSHSDYFPELEERTYPDSGKFLHSFRSGSLSVRSFEWNTALSLALASKIVYSGGDVVERIGRQDWNLQSCEFVEKDNTQCFVATSADATLVSFRGTENHGDWMSNLDFLSTSRRYGKVHRGFLAAFQVVQKELENIVGRYPTREVVLVGHSLGGALALIAAAEWSQKFDVQKIHTFGQPAVGKNDFAAFIDSSFGNRYRRFVNEDDIVPRVPPWFKHCGLLMHFDKNGGLKNTIDTPETESLELSLEPAPVDTETMSELEFLDLQLRLKAEKVRRGGAPLGEEAVAMASEGSRAGEDLEGVFPSISDHNLDIYVAKTASFTGE